MIRHALASAVAAAALSLPPTASADPVADFYRGKQIKMVLPTAAGGSTSLYGLAVAEFLQRHIPGKPAIVAEYRTGAGGVVATNYLYNAAPRDGSVIAMVLSSMPLVQQLQPRSVKFDIAKFGYIGRAADSPRALIAWHDAGLATIEDAKKKEVPLGASGRTSITAIHPLLLNRLIGTKFKIVTGYRGAGQTYVALEAGELGATTATWDGLVSHHGDWLRDGKVKILAFIGERAYKGYESVPQYADLGPTPKDRAALRMTLLFSDMGQAVGGPPAMPKARLDALRKAFEATMMDPAFRAMAKKRSMPIEPLGGEALQKLIVRGMDVPKPVVERVRKLTGIDDFGGVRKKQSK